MLFRRKRAKIALRRKTGAGRKPPGPAAPAVFEGYKSRSLVLGKHIDILSPGREPESAEAVELAEDYALIARMPDGSLRRLSSGEGSVKV